MTRHRTHRIESNVTTDKVVSRCLQQPLNPLRSSCVKEASQPRVALAAAEAARGAVRAPAGCYPSGPVRCRLAGSAGQAAAPAAAMSCVLRKPPAPSSRPFAAPSDDAPCHAADRPPPAVRCESTARARCSRCCRSPGGRARSSGSWGCSTAPWRRATSARRACRRWRRPSGGSARCWLRPGVHRPQPFPGCGRRGLAAVATDAVPD